MNEAIRNSISIYSRHWDRFWILIFGFWIGYFFIIFPFHCSFSKLKAIFSRVNETHLFLSKREDAVKGEFQDSESSKNNEAAFKEVASFSWNEFEILIPLDLPN